MVDGDMAVETDSDYLYVYEHCEYVEVTGTYTDDARDEVYEETGFECDERRTSEFRIERCERLPSSDTEDGSRTNRAESDSERVADGVEVTYDADPSAFIEATGRVAERLNDGEIFDYWTHGSGVDAAIEMRVEVGGDEYHVRYEKV
jgi:8-oxo-dGTP pyrophosphatase MutT (NUDIX family)